MVRLQARPWRGNIRELRNFVERVLIMAEGETIEEQDVADVEQAGVYPVAASPSPPPIPAGDGHAPTVLEAVRPAPSSGPDPAQFATLQQYREEAEKVFILRKLREFRWNVSRMAKAIETPRSNLYKKLEQYGITRDQVQE